MVDVIVVVDHATTKSMVLDQEYLQAPGLFHVVLDPAHDDTLDHHNLVWAIVHHYLVFHCRRNDLRQNFLGYQSIVNGEEAAVMVVASKCWKKSKLSYCWLMWFFFSLASNEFFYISTTFNSTGSAYQFFYWHLVVCAIDW